MAERERSRGSVWLRQAALTPLGALIFLSAEIAGWHSETAQWEPQRSASKKHKEQKKFLVWSCLWWASLQKGDGETLASPRVPPPSLDPPPPQPWLCSHPALLPAEPVPVCQDPSPAQGLSLLLLLRSAAPGMCWGNQSWSLITPKISTDTKSQVLGCSQAAVSCTGQTQTVHQVNASHMPLFAKLQDFFYRHCALVFQTSLIFFLYYPMTEGWWEWGNSLTATVPPERHKTSERNNLLLLKP